MFVLLSPIMFSTMSATAAATVAQADSAVPAVSSIAFISSPARGDTYELGETIEVEVEFDSAVTATGRPQVELTIGTQTRHATFSRLDSQSLYPCTKRTVMRTESASRPTR